MKKQMTQMMIMGALVTSVCMGGTYSVQADYDALSMPAPAAAPSISVEEKHILVPAPSTYVQSEMDRYVAWYNEQTRTADSHVPMKILEDGTELSVSEVINQRFVQALKDRKHFYEWSHRYDIKEKHEQSTYAMDTLQAMINDIEFATTGRFIATTEPHHIDLWAAIQEPATPNVDEPVNPAHILDIEKEHMSRVNNSELRSYANEMILFAIHDTMNDKSFK